MDAPVIVLRFRDTTPGVDTITEHLNLLQQEGAVWWGWWRKEREQATAQDVPHGPLRVILADRSTHRMFSADCERFTALGREVDPKQVPKYYRYQVSEIEGFFKLTRLAATPYDQSLADRLGERTMMRLGELGADPAEHIADVIEAAGRSSVLHLSDLHFGADYGYLVQGQHPVIGDGRRTLTDCIMADLERIGLQNDVAAVIVTGDFITRGDWNDGVRKAALDEFGALRTALKLSKQQIVAVPGNHDIVRYADGANVDISALAVSSQTNQQHEREFRTFVDELIDRDWKESLNYIRKVSLSNVDIDICVLNSCTITATKWREYGYIGISGIDTIRTMGQMKIERPTFRFIALHHHLLPVAAVEAPASEGVTLALDASTILAEAQAAGVQVVLHGHQHKAKLSTYMDLLHKSIEVGDPIHVVSNGSAGAKSNRLPDGENNTYCIFTVAQERLHLRVRELRTSAQQGFQIFDQQLNIKATLPSHLK